MSEAIDRVKVLLGITDDKQDKLLEEIERNTRSLYKSITDTLTVPKEHEYMIVEIMVRRFNRIGSEGMSSQSVEGLSQTFKADDFDDYLQILDDKYRLNLGRRGVKFL